MAAKASLLDWPVDRAVRHVALGLVQNAAAARARLGPGDDATALHDFRVALRRLRSWLRAFRPHAQDAPSGRVRRALREMAAATGASRDAEVQLEWLTARRTRTQLRQRAAIDALLAKVAETKAEGDAAVRDAVDRFDEERERIEREMRTYRRRVDVAEPRDEERFAAVAARLLTEHAAVLAAHLEAAASFETESEAHAARIAAKRLRYLLEPLRGDAPAAARIVEELKALQDGLGELHDAQRLQRAASDEALPRVGLASLRQLLAAREKRAVAALRRTWAPARTVRLLASARGLATRLEERSRRGIEIERKFLLTGVPPEARRHPSVTIDQGYLPGKLVAERIRRVRYGRRVDYVRSMKAGTGIVRMEVEEKTTKATFDGLWRLTGHLRLRKRRYAVPAGDLAWEIDEFLDRDLVLAEIELPREDAPVEIPAWLAPHVVREVTGEPAYENHHIALKRGRSR